MWQALFTRRTKTLRTILTNIKILRVPIVVPPKKLDQKSNFLGVFILAKYSYEFKRKIVEEYLEGIGSYKYLTKK